MNAAGIEWPEVENPGGCHQESEPTGTLGAAMGCGQTPVPPPAGSPPSHLCLAPEWHLLAPFSLTPHPSFVPPPHPRVPVPSDLVTPSPQPWPGAPSFSATLTWAAPVPPSQPLVVAFVSTSQPQNPGPKLWASGAPWCLQDVASFWTGVPGLKAWPLRPSVAPSSFSAALWAPALMGSESGRSPSLPATPSLPGPSSSSHTCWGP